MCKNENQMAKQACENAVDPKHSTSGTRGTGSWEQGEDKKLGGGEQLTTAAAAK